MKETKKLIAMLERWGTKLRSGNSAVYHPVYKHYTECSPLQFAVYETYLKSHDAIEMSLQIEETHFGNPNPKVAYIHIGMEKPTYDTWRKSVHKHHSTIAKRDGFLLLKELPCNRNQAMQDRAYCYKCLYNEPCGDDGDGCLGYELLD